MHFTLDPFPFTCTNQNIFQFLQFHISKNFCLPKFKFSFISIQSQVLPLVAGPITCQTIIAGHSGGSERMQSDLNSLFYFSDQTNITQAWKPFYTEFPREATSCGWARNSMCLKETNTNVCLHETNMLSLNNQLLRS